MLGTSESEDRTGLILPGKIRWIALAAGCLSLVTGSTGLGLGFAIWACPLILGAALQPRFPRPGAWLMAADALLLSFWMLPIGIGILFDTARNLHRYHDFVLLGVTFLWVLSSLLVGWCDAALVIEAVKLKRCGSSPFSPS